MPLTDHVNDIDARISLLRHRNTLVSEQFVYLAAHGAKRMSVLKNTAAGTGILVAIIIGVLIPPIGFIMLFFLIAYAVGKKAREK